MAGSERPMEEEPTQKVRKFKTKGDGTVTWNWDPTDVRHGHLRHWGRIQCTGCGANERGLEWSVANKHAANCYQIP